VEENVQHIENIAGPDVGSIKITDEVVAIIAGIAAIEVPGVASMSGGIAGGIAEALGRKNLTKGVKVEVGEKEAAIDLYIIIEYGCRIPDVAWNIQEKVKKSVETMTGLQVVEVNIHVQGVNIEVLTKKDIDLKSAPMYAEMLRLARLDIIVKENAAEGSSTIYYYQVFSLPEAGTELKQPLIAHLKKTDEKWVILGIKEGNETEAPFKGAV
jgi:uncharacterized alkaline shock family protein YloU